MDETRDESLVRNAFFQGLCLKPVQVAFGYSDVDSLVFIRSIASVGLILLLELFELFDRSPFVLFIGTKDIFFAVIVLLRFHFFLSDSVSWLSCPETERWMRPIMRSLSVRIAACCVSARIPGRFAP